MPAPCGVQLITNPLTYHYHIMNITISAWELVNLSSFAKHYTACALEYLADYIEEKFHNSKISIYDVDEILMDSTEEYMPEAVKRLGYKNSEELLEDLRKNHFRAEYMSNGNLLVIL